MPILSESRGRQIREAYAPDFSPWDNREVTADDFLISNYYGTFNGISLVTIRYLDGISVNDLSSNIIVDGILIDSVHSEHRFVAFDGNNFTTINEVYAQGLLSYEDLQTMAFRRIRHDHARQLYWETNPGAWPQNERELQAIFDNILVDVYYETISFYDDTNIYGYLWCYEVLTLSYKDSPNNLTGSTITTGGYEFALPNGHSTLWIGSGSRLMCIVARYNDGVIPLRVISTLHARYFA
jgi:hypothetical protein